jgi:hypothetical protein
MRQAGTEKMQAIYELPFLADKRKQSITFFQVKKAANCLCKIPHLLRPGPLFVFHSLFTTLFPFKKTISLFEKRDKRLSIGSGHCPQPIFLSGRDSLGQIIIRNPAFLFYKQIDIPSENKNRLLNN